MKPNWCRILGHSYDYQGNPYNGRCTYCRRFEKGPNDMDTNDLNTRRKRTTINLYYMSVACMTVYLGIEESLLYSLLFLTFAFGLASFCSALCSDWV